ncbi:MAG: hypothetical protein V4459_08405 [Pseudomonadota bacterium]
MVTGHEQLQRYAQAARELMEAGFVDADAGRYSRTIFASARKGGDPAIVKCIFEAASMSGFCAVMLEFGRSATAKGPVCFTVSMADGDGGAQTTRDCALALDADGKYVLVPRGAVSATFHFAIGEQGLERRHGRVANLAACTVRASRDLAARSRKVASYAPGLSIFQMKAA